MPCRHIARTSIGRADHFWGAEDFEGTDDEEAIRKVQQTMDGREAVLSFGCLLTRSGIRPRREPHSLLSDLASKMKHLARLVSKPPQKMGVIVLALGKGRQAHCSDHQPTSLVANNRTFSFTLLHVCHR